MTMDLVSVKHQKEMDGTQEIFELNENFHDFLLKFASPRKQFPLLYKLEDYYSDNLLLLGELAQFKKELKLIDMATNKIKSKEIDVLLHFIDAAIKKGHNICVLAD